MKTPHLASIPLVFVISVAQWHDAVWLFQVPEGKTKAGKAQEKREVPAGREIIIIIGDW